MARAKRGDSDYISPNNGGCWFCHRQSSDMAFDSEFDTFAHLLCLKSAYEQAKKRVEKDPEDMCESLLMAYLLEQEAV